MIHSIVQLVRRNPIEWGLSVFAVCISGAMSVVVYHYGLMTILADQSAHLVFARLLTDSLTPGISQLGLWPPLFHVLMAPFAAVPKLFQSGFAGFICLLPFFVMSVVLLYRLTLRITNSIWLSIFGAVLYSTNPFVLYYSATPMMEILFLFFVISTAYFCVEWLTDNRLHNLLFVGMSIALGSIARFEALLLLPVVGIIVLIQLIKRRFSYIKIEATMILFFTMATAGLCLLMLYDFAYFNTPLGFLHVASPNWTAEVIGNGVGYEINPFVAFSRASFYMLGYPLVMISLTSAVLVMIFSRRRFILASALVILLVPAISVIISLMQGVATVLVPEISLLHDFHNVRYALTWVGFVSLVLATLPAVILSRSSSLLSKIFVSLFVVIVAGFSGFHFYSNVVENQFSVIRHDRSTTDHITSIDVASYLSNNYDHGFILFNRFGNDDVFIRAGIPLSTYIQEGNYGYYSEALKYPWIFARFVIMLDPQTLARNGWISEVTNRWFGSDKFSKYYELVFQNRGVRVYRLKEDVVKKSASEIQVPEKDVPSLGSSTKAWSFNNPNLTRLEANL